MNNDDLKLKVNIHFNYSNINILLTMWFIVLQFHNMFINIMCQPISVMVLLMLTV